MGKGRIIQVDGDGSYWVELVHDVQTIIDRKLSIEKSRSELLEPLARARHDADVAYAEAIGARSRLNDAIASGDQVWMQEAATESARATSIEGATEANWSVMDAEYTAKTAEIRSLETALTQRDPVVFCWCADYTFDLDVGAVVGTIEIPDEYNPARPLIVQPGWRPDDPKAGALWDAGRDGCLLRANAQGPYQAYYNAVMLPGLQKYKPFYRVGELLQIKDGNGYVVIDREQSSASRSNAYKLFTADGFHINPPGADTSDQALNFIAPIVYMDCNYAAFTEGDRVIVYFGGSWDTPTIIGFESNPVSCEITGFLCFPSADAVYRNGWGEPFTDDNKPLGTVITENEALDHSKTLVTPDGEYLRGGDEQYLAKYPIDGPPPMAGNCDWYGEALGGRRLSWNRPGHRYFGYQNLDWDNVLWGFRGNTYAMLPGVRGYSQSVNSGRTAIESVAVNDGLSEFVITKTLPMNDIYFDGVVAEKVGGSSINNWVNGVGAIEHAYTDNNGDLAIVTWMLYVFHEPIESGTGADVDIFVAQQVEIQNGRLVLIGTSFGIGSVSYDGMSMWLPDQGCWSFSQSGRKAATVRNDNQPNVPPILGANRLYEVAFTADENNVTMSDPVITAQSTGTEEWMRNINLPAEYFRSVFDVDELIAVDYKGNVLMKAVARMHYEEITDIKQTIEVDGSPLNHGYLTNGRLTKVGTIKLLINGVSSVMLADFSEDRTYKYNIVCSSDTLMYSSSMDDNNTRTDNEITAIDLRNGYVAYDTVVDNATYPAQYSGTNPSGRCENIVSKGFFWSGVENRKLHAIFSDNYPPLGTVWTGKVDLDQSTDVSGSDDYLTGDNTIGVDTQFMYQSYPTDVNSGVIERYGVPVKTYFYRPTSVVVSKSGTLVALSSANGFGRVRWAFAVPVQEQTFTNWPDEITNSAGLSGHTKPRVCPLFLL